MVCLNNWINILAKIINGIEKMDRRDVKNNKVGFAEIFNIVFEEINTPMIFPAT